jgi:hypothetical protein
MSDTPQWLEALVEVVTDAMTGHSVPGPVGFRYREEDGCWELLVYQLPVELLGGQHDGEVVFSGYWLDLEVVRSAFTRVDAVSWQAHSMSDQDEGPYVSMEGEYAGHEVWLRILAFAPDDEEPGMKVDTNNT